VRKRFHDEMRPSHLVGGVSFDQIHVIYPLPSFHMSERYAYDSHLTAYRGLLLHFGYGINIHIDRVLNIEFCVSDTHRYLHVYILEKSIE